jgi:hypothetical protein
MADAFIKNWIHNDGEAYPVESCNVLRVHKFSNLLFVEFQAIDTSKQYGDKTYYTRKSTVVKDESLQKMLCELLGCDYSKLVNKEMQKKGQQKTGAPTVADEVPF